MVTHRQTVVLAAALLTAPIDAAFGADAGLVLPPGFTATIFADTIGRARHLAVASDGTVYVNTWGAADDNDGTVSTSGVLVALRDTRGVGKADVVERFGGTLAGGDHGGTGIAIHDGKLYAETNDRIVRYDLRPGALAPMGPPVTVVSGLPTTGDHPMHPFAIDKAGALYVDLGSATNACQADNRVAGSPGLEPCVETQTRGGIWRYDADKTGQVFAAKDRFATGLRNGEGIDVDRDGRIYATQHGRDQLFENWPGLYTAEQGHDLPAEELVQLTQGGDYGWPRCYFDGGQGKLVLAPEYGGDGGKTVGSCADRTGPLAFFPAHYAPDDMKIYAGASFPTAYDGGAFIAFHGSWNRAPAPQGGYNVVFQPLKDGKSSGRWLVFADGFAQGRREPSTAPHRPCGLAIGPTGALYVSDDVGGGIWRITYTGDKAAPTTGAPGATGPGLNSSVKVRPPEGLHPDAGTDPGH